VIQDRQLDEAALALEKPEALTAIRKRAMADPFMGSFRGPPMMGHYVEVSSMGRDEYRGKRGVVTVDGGRGLYKIAFADGTTSDWLNANALRSSGLDESAFLTNAMAARAEEVRTAREQLPEAMRKALAELRRRVQCDELPLLSLLQAEPLQVQSSHLSFQEYFAAVALCEKGTKLSGSPPWQWSSWWANAVSLGSEMGEAFGRGLLRATPHLPEAAQKSSPRDEDEPSLWTATPPYSIILFAPSPLMRTGYELDSPEMRRLQPRTHVTVREIRVMRGGCTRAAIELEGEGGDLEHGWMTLIKKNGEPNAELVPPERPKLEEVKQITINAETTVLDLSKGKLAGHRPTTVRVVVALMPSLRGLNLSSNMLQADECKTIARGLASNTSLTRLDVSSNNYMSDGSSALQNAVKGRKGFRLDTDLATYRE